MSMFSNTVVPSHYQPYSAPASSFWAVALGFLFDALLVAGLMSSGVAADMGPFIFPLVLLVIQVVLFALLYKPLDVLSNPYRISK